MLKQRILSQDLELGVRVKDDELAEQLGVSRTPVREALMRLHREGLVTCRPAQRHDGGDLLGNGRRSDL